MNYLDDFFEDEVIEGFYVPSIMKMLWAAKLEVLLDIGKVCKRHQIKWHISFGTLLGAVRHQGFIPWDDDIDIAMCREDYEHFLEIAETEMPEYIIKNMYTDTGYYDFTTVVANGENFSFQKEYLEKFYGLPYPAGVDIFVLDYISVNEEEENLRENLLHLIWDTAYRMPEKGAMDQNLRDALVLIQQATGVELAAKADVKHELFVLFDKLCAIYQREEAEYAACLPYKVMRKHYTFPKEILEDCVDMDFCGEKLPGVREYDRYLREEYGDYTVKQRTGGDHGYPAFRRYEKPYLEIADRIPYRYEFAEEHLQASRVCTEEGVKTSETKILFLVYKYASWKYMEDPYRYWTKQDNVTVDILVIPYYRTDFLGNRIGKYYDYDKFVDVLPVTDISNYDLRKERPDIIYTHNLWDDCNATTTIQPEFYSAVIKHDTDRLVYIPDFEVDAIDPADEKGMYSTNFFIKMPGVIHADEVRVSHPKMRDLYINVLMEFTGKSRKYWEKRIICPENEKNEKNEKKGLRI
ncbi:MAG: LicD family protein [Eubacteriales bacterium]|nr:LicD family protein [Eubacteriales bacterium]